MREEAGEAFLPGQSRDGSPPDKAEQRLTACFDGRAGERRYSLCFPGLSAPASSFRRDERRRRQRARTVTVMRMSKPRQLQAREQRWRYSSVSLGLTCSLPEELFPVCQLLHQQHQDQLKQDRVCGAPADPIPQVVQVELELKWRSSVNSATNRTEPGLLASLFWVCGSWNLTPPSVCKPTRMFTDNSEFTSNSGLLESI